MRQGGLRTRRVGLGILASLGLIAGCGGSDETVPTSVPFSPVAGPVVEEVARPTGATAVLMILPAGNDQHAAVWERAAQGKAGVLKVFLESVRPGPSDPPDEQARILADAANRGAGVVIVVPHPDDAAAPKLADAARKAIDAGVKVIALGRPLPASGDPVPCITVAPPSEEELAGQIVEALLVKAKAREGQNLEKGPALIVNNTKSEGPWIQERARGYRKALEKAGIPVLEDLVVESPGDGARDRVMAILKGPNPPKILLPTDAWALQSCGVARTRAEKLLDLLVGGFADDPQVIDFVKAGSLEVAADVQLERVGWEGVSVAAGLIAGKKVPERVVVPVPILRSSRDPEPVHDEVRLRKPTTLGR